ncbi:hypothetical protein Pcinc_019180 [Petrolisthes cinctipes]|uniref:Uncharacterized protein n=1 Tax=Petrolisthes cinctipes TaxID=88211 RepID=A0AAE1FLE6_PETCI|nr:hypothetical protein Pcinc_019180 [Petrolisthes cinctipes]
MEEPIELHTGKERRNNKMVSRVKRVKDPVSVIRNPNRASLHPPHYHHWEADVYPAGPGITSSSPPLCCVWWGDSGVLHGWWAVTFFLALPLPQSVAIFLPRRCTSSIPHYS